MKKKKSERHVDNLTKEQLEKKRASGRKSYHKKIDNMTQDERNSFNEKRQVKNMTEEQRINRNETATLNRNLNKALFRDMPRDFKNL